MFTHQENIIPANNSELQAVAHPITDMDHNSILLIVTADSQQIYLLSSSALQPRLKASRALTIIVNHTSAYLQHGLWFQGINTALDVLQAALLQQPTPSLTWYASSENPHQDDFPGHPLGFLLWILVFMCCTWIFRYTTRLRYALKFAFAMACGNFMLSGIVPVLWLRRPHFKPSPLRCGPQSSELAHFWPPYCGRESEDKNSTLSPAARATGSPAICASAADGKINQPLRHRFLPPVGDEPGRQGHQRQFAMPKTTRKRPKRRLNHRALRFLQHKAVMHLAPPALNIIVERVAGKRPPRARG